MGSEGLTIELFQPEDAPGVADLFRAVYGEGYPVKAVYDPHQLIEAFHKRDNIPIVARSSGKRVVGYSSLFRGAPGGSVYEMGNGAVLPEFRNEGIFGMIFQYVKKILPTLRGVDVFFGEPVCNHIHTQKGGAAAFGAIEMALELDLMPAEAYGKEKSASGRVSTLLMFTTIVPRPHTVYVPQVYTDCFQYLYDGYDDKRFFSPSTGDLPDFLTTHISTQVLEAAQVARITVQDAGSDFEQAFLSEEGSLLNRNVLVVQVWLKLSCPWIGRIVEVLRSRGYFLGGILPQWFGEDGLLLQKILSRPNWDEIHLFRERGRKILEIIRTDGQI